VVTHKQLLRSVWGEKAENPAQYLRVHITHARQKIEPDSAYLRPIQTETDIGYGSVFRRKANDALLTFMFQELREFP
jgi:DNA-binding response OmpR family regulator